MWILKSFSIIFPRDDNIMKKKHVVVVFYGTCFNYSSFISLMKESKVWKIDFTFLRTNIIGLVGRVFTNGPGDLGSIQGHVIPKTLKMVLDTSLLNTQ